MLYLFGTLQIRKCGPYEEIMGLERREIERERERTYILHVILR